jgi:conjugal transfer pilus assembly protein TraA
MNTASNTLRNVALIGLTVAAVGTAVAGTGGTEFDAALTAVRDWFEGSLGKLIAITTLGVGLGIGIMKQSIMAVVVGVSMALALAYGPGVLDGMIAANLPV